MASSVPSLPAFSARPRSTSAARVTLSADSTSVAPHCLSRCLHLASGILCPPRFYPVFLSALSLTARALTISCHQQEAGHKSREPRAGADRDGCAAGPSPSCSVSLATRPNSWLSVAGSCKSIPSSWENKKGEQGAGQSTDGSPPPLLAGRVGLGSRKSSLSGLHAAVRLDKCLFSLFPGASGRLKTEARRSLCPARRVAV